MRISEVIAQLQAIAQQLPEGTDTAVQIGRCDGSAVELTQVFEIDSLAEVSTADGTVGAVTVIIKSHPHNDSAVQVYRGIAENADDAVRDWSQEP